LGDEIDARLIVPGAAAEYRDARMIQAVPDALNGLVYKSFQATRILTERCLLGSLSELDAVYTFPAISPATVKRIHRTGMPVVLERVNCARQSAKKVLDDAYRRLVEPIGDVITTEQVALELDEIADADYIVCASPLSKQSFLECDVPPEKIIEASYGWSPQRFGTIPPHSRSKESFTVLFVGRVCVRKGAHLLLDAWARANVRGRLILVGAMEPAIAQSCREILARTDVTYLPYTREVGKLYQEADVFAFPTLTEGSPLVTYEAMAHGLALLVSPMAAGAVMRDGVEGKVLGPYDADGWVDALREFASDTALRERYGQAARVRADEFTWDKVAARRGQALMTRLSGVRQ